MKNFAGFTPRLEAWFAKYGRHDLPWRTDYNSYHVWVAEIMLQQTQVSRVKSDYYPRFLERFPTLESLAHSTWNEMYPVWQGLGYYSRGKNMLKAAQMVMKKFRGNFPENYHDLVALPGVGSYTANAILAFAFDQSVAAVDTNIAKIIRVIESPENLEKLSGRDIQKIAKQLVSESTSGRIWNGAMMDLASQLRTGKLVQGALGEMFFPENCRKLFLPKKRKPAERKTKKIPRKIVGQKYPDKNEKRRIEVGIACIHQDGKYLIQTRPKGKTFAGSWEFPGGKREKGEDFRACVKREIQEEIGIDVSVRPHFFQEIHEFENVELLLRFHRCQIQAGEPVAQEKQKLKWVTAADFGKINFLKTNAQALKRLKEFRS